MGCVYIFKHNNFTPVKIGCSTKSSPQNRFEQLKTYAPFGAEIIGFVETNEPFKLEKRIHLLFANKRMHGEWFDLNINDIDILMSMLNGYKTHKNEVYLWMKKNGIIINKEIYISDLCNRIRNDCNIENSNRNIVLSIINYCKSKNLNVKRQRNHKGRYMIINF